MSTTPVLPDIPYLPNRERLLKYEDARFQSLLSGMPDCYSPLTDSTIWGTCVRALAQELARMEYYAEYGMVTIEPQYLTPPDIQRRYAAPLFINKSFPNAAQTDQDYKAMLVALIAAYKQGTTLQAITDVITAYTGQVINVEELYKLIGTGGVEDYDRNTLRLSVDGSQGGVLDPLTAIQSAAWIQTISQDLFTAITLAKPAHIGVDYSVSFGSDEDMHARIAAITDTLVMLLDGVEAPPLPPIFTQAPFLDPDSPDTRLSAYGKLASKYLAASISAVQYAALLSDAYRAEYLVNPDGTYSLNPACLNDILLEDSSGNPTGEVSQAQGVLAPQLVRSWEIKSDTLVIFELD